MYVFQSIYGCVCCVQQRRRRIKIVVISIVHRLCDDKKNETNSSFLEMIKQMCGCCYLKYQLSKCATTKLKSSFLYLFIQFTLFGYFHFGRHKTIGMFSISVLMLLLLYKLRRPFDRPTDDFVISIDFV